MKKLLLAAIAIVAAAPAFGSGCFVSGVTDQYTYFVAVDATDFTSRETGLSGFTVYRSRNGGAAAAFTTPTINETDATNMPGTYELLLDEDMTIDTGDDMHHMALHITVSGMAPVTKEICIERPKITAGETATVDSNGRVDVGSVGGTAQTANDNGADINAILTDTAEIGAAGAGLSAVPWNASWDAEVESEANDALVAENLDHLLAAAVTGTDVTDNSALAQLVGDDATADWDTFDNTTDSLEALRNHVGDGTNLTEAGGTGDQLSAIPWNASWDTEVQSEATDALEADGLDHLLAAAVAGTDITNDSIIAQLVGDDATADWDSFDNTTDSLEAISNAGGGGDGSGFTAIPWNSAWDAEVESEVDDSIGGGTGTALTAIPWNASWDTEVESEATDALEADGLDHLIAAAVTGTDVTDNSIIAVMVGDDATADFDSFDNTTESLEALRNRGDTAWTTGSGTGLTAIASGTAQGGTASTIQLASGESFGDDLLNGAAVVLTGGTGAGQHAVVIDYVGSTDTATVHTQYANNEWVTNPSTDTTYEVVPATGNTQVWNGAGVTTDVQTANDVANSVWDENQSEHTSTGTMGVLASEIADILTDTGEIGTAGAGLSGIPWNASWDTEVQSEANDALIANHLDHLFGADYDPASPPGTSTAWANELVESDGGVTRYTANALEQAPSGGGGGGDITSISGDSAAADNLEALLDGTGGITLSGDLSGSVGSISGVTFPTNFASLSIDGSGIADANVEEINGNSTAADRLQQEMSSWDSGTIQADGGGTVTLDAANNANDDFYNNGLLVVYAGTGANQARRIEDYNGTTKVATLSSAFTVSLSTDSDYLIVPDDTVSADLGISEPAGVPDFNDDAGAVLSWLLALSRNEIQQTATTKTIRNDADNGDIATCAVSDDGTTFQRSECQ